MRSELNIGRILKPRGLKGELKLEAYSGMPERFSGLKFLKIDGTEYRVLKLSAEGSFAYVFLEGIDAFEKADKLRGKEISAKRAELPPPPEGRFYIVDMLGLEVYAGGEKVGELEDVLQYGSADVYVIRSKDGTISVPAIKELVKETDLENGRLVLDDRVFARTAVYNIG